MKRFLLFAVLLLLSLSPAYAADIAVSASGTGSKTGSDWNNTADWSTMSFTRGNTYYLADGTYGGKTLNTATSGSTYIYIKKATAGAHGPSTGWDSTYGDGVADFRDTTVEFTTDYWDFSGVTGGGPGSWRTGHGISFSTVNTVDLSMVKVSGRSYIHLRHIHFYEIGNTESSPGCTGIYAAASPSTYSNSTVEYNLFENLGMLPLFFRAGTGLIIQYNYMGNICGQSIYNGAHCEAMVIWGMNDMHFRWNYIAEGPSSGGIVQNSGTATDIRIYGNVLENAFPINCNSACTNWVVVNNTYHRNRGGPFGVAGTVTNLIDWNNLAYNFSDIDGMSGDHDYNLFSLVSGVQYTMNIAENENCVDSSPDYCPETADPFINSTNQYDCSTPGGVTLSCTEPEDVFLSPTSFARDAGYNLCATKLTCDATNQYNIDAYGNTRGSDGTWDVGAYEYTGGSVSGGVYDFQIHIHRD